ncbi:MAG: hypothetical protein M3Y33_14450 [Actinomycetota bacterium]|nr:hypothetical protein [Actinomycetota bacterium]
MDGLTGYQQRRLDLRELAREVAGLIPAHSCPVCVALAGRERQATAQLAAQAQPSGMPALCLRHLALVLDAGPSPETGRALAGSLAAALRRAAQDMRSFALKREALRRGLVTDEEAQAHDGALRLLAGQPSLVRPGEPE